ncbi:glutamyl endopeptidase [Bradyrhizobium japonicum]|uniref:trypsin-like serine peptidase n=1 Tax=Bradyrhizobium liaoningense TaxID=43992 RepID=UPI001BAD2B7F|nr:trypsin-like serine protease [Bradyrhizobium liaoningense]MBR1071160.1 trypsin-like serine protease [Bradyrhizobium liaoningense]
MATKTRTPKAAAKDNSSPVAPTMCVISDATRRRRDGRMTETNGGSSVERVPGFNALRPMTAGFDTTRVSGPTILASVADGGFFSIAPQTLVAAAPSLPNYGGTGKPEDVIGVDDRVIIPDSSLTPWRCICHLEITYDSGQVGFGTGWFAGERTVITAGHCLYARPTAIQPARRARQVRVIPGRNGNLAPYGYVVADKFDWHPKWESEKEEKDAAPYDYGVIFVDHEVNGAPFGERIGYFGLRSYEKDEEKLLDMAIVNNAGYPHEAAKPYGSLWFNAGRVHMQDAAHKDDRFLEYMVDTTGGDSGSPVFLFDSTANQRYVVAVHTTGNFINRGVRITAEVYDQILAWAK